MYQHHVGVSSVIRFRILKCTNFQIWGFGEFRNPISWIGPIGGWDRFQGLNRCRCCFKGIFFLCSKFIFICSQLPWKRMSRILFVIVCVRWGWFLVGVGWSWFNFFNYVLNWHCRLQSSHFPLIQPFHLFQVDRQFGWAIQVLFPCIFDTFVSR